MSAKLSFLLDLKPLLFCSLGLSSLETLFEMKVADKFVTIQRRPSVVEYLFVSRSSRNNNNNNNTCPVFSLDLHSRGLEKFSRSWLPETYPPKAIVCFCHGYGDTCTFFFEGLARKMALHGMDYGVFAMDDPGFGLSEGLHGYIPSFESERIADYLILCLPSGNQADV